MPKRKKTAEQLPQPSYFEIALAEVMKAHRKRQKAERARLRRLGLKPPKPPKVPVSWDNLLMLH